MLSKNYDAFFFRPKRLVSALIYKMKVIFKVEMTKNQRMFNSLMQFNETLLLQNVKKTTYFPNKIVQKRPRQFLELHYKSELAYYGQNF